MREDEIKFDNTRDNEMLIKEKQKASRKSLGGAMAEHSLWTSTEGTGKRRGVTDPEGNFLPLGKNEYFAIEKNFDKGTFEAVAKDKKGSIVRILGKGKLSIREQESMLNQRDEKEVAEVREKLGLVYKEGERKILPSKRENLPPLKEGFMRLVHITDPNTAQKIADSGLNYELQGMISSTARAFSKAEDVVLENEDRRFSFPGARAVIIDIPINEY